MFQRSIAHLLVQLGELIVGKFRIVERDAKLFPAAEAHSSTARTAIAIGLVGSGQISQIGSHLLEAAAIGRFDPGIRGILARIVEMLLTESREGQSLRRIEMAKEGSSKGMRSRKPTIWINLYILSLQ